MIHVTTNTSGKVDEHTTTTLAHLVIMTRESCNTVFNRKMKSHELYCTKRERSDMQYHIRAESTLLKLGPQL